MTLRRIGNAIVVPTPTVEERVKFLEAALGDALSRVAAIEARLDRNRRLRDADDRRVFDAIVSCDGVTSRYFTAGALRKHARFVPELNAALAAADCDSNRSLGKLFARLEGCDFDGLCLRRVGRP